MRSRVVLITGSLFVLSALACDEKPATQPQTEQPTKEGVSAKADTDTDTDAKADAKPEAGPSNTAAREFAQSWATPSGQPTAYFAGARGDRVYVLAGPYVEFGTPASSLVCLEASSGKLLWTHSGDQTLNLDGASDSLLDVSTMEGAGKILSAETGKATKPTKAESDATTPIEGPAEAQGCASEGAKLSCEGWSVEESGALSKLGRYGDAVCYAVAGSLEIRCRAAASGDLDFALAVPKVEGVKDPEAVKFSFALVGDQLIVANYDGTVLAYAPR